MLHFEIQGLELFLDGTRVTGGIHVSRLGDEHDDALAKVSIGVEEQELSRKIAAHKISDLPKQIKYLSLHLNYRILGPSWMWESITLRQGLPQWRQEGAEWSLGWTVGFFREEFPGPFTIRNYFETFRELAPALNLRVESYSPDATTLAFPVQADHVIADEFWTHEKDVMSLHDQTLTAVLSRLSDNSVSISFDFPEDVRIACEQYLQYFAQFLQDLGVNAQTSLIHEAGRALFTVTPTDRQDALENIRIALEVYLKLPSSPIEDAVNESVEVLTLRSELHQLHAKLNLAAARLELKNATIEAKEQTILGKQQIIELLERMRTGQVVEASKLGLDSRNAKEQKTEAVIEGYVSLTTLEKHGVKVELGAIYKVLKRLFKKARLEQTLQTSEEEPAKGDWR